MYKAVHGDGSCPTRARIEACKAGWQRGPMKKPKHPLDAEFEALYQHHSREVWALVYARWLNADVAQDIMQETFLRLWKQRQHDSLIVNPRAWLLRVARN